MVIEHAHSGGIFTLDCVKHGSANLIVSGSRDRSIKLWDRNSEWRMAKTLFPPHYDGVSGLAVAGSHRGKMYSVSRDKSLKEWDLETMENKVQQIHAHQDWINCVAMSPDEKVILTGSRDCVIKLWDAETLQCIDAYTGHRGAISQVLCVNDYVFSASHDRTVRVWKMDK